MRRSRFNFLAVVAIAMAAGLPAKAQDYPTKPVTFITPAAAGNSPDVVTRVVADRLTQIWQQQIVVLNRPGAGGLIAAQAAAGVEKDGYSLYVAQASTFTVLPIDQEGKMPVNLQTAFVPIGMGGRATDRALGEQGRARRHRRPADRARQQDAGRDAVRRHQSRRTVAPHGRAVP